MIIEVDWDPEGLIGDIRFGDIAWNPDEPIAPSAPGGRLFGLRSGDSPSPKPDADPLAVADHGGVPGADDARGISRQLLLAGPRDADKPVDTTLTGGDDRVRETVSASLTEPELP